MIRNRMLLFPLEVLALVAEVGGGTRNTRYHFQVCNEGKISAQ